MMHHGHWLIAALAAVSCVGIANEARAWGHTGHIIVAHLAMRSLPDEVPDFLRTHAAAREVGQLGPEADVLKSAGDAGKANADTADFEHSPAHFINIDEAGNVEGFASVPLSALFTGDTIGRRGYDTLLRAANADKNTQYDGYLPYQIVDGWQTVRKDMAYVRAYTAAIENPATAEDDRAEFKYQLELRRKLILRDIGYWSHFVGDASQPMHVSIHFNGWDPNHKGYPNPNGYTDKPIHVPFESPFVKQFVTEKDVAPLVGPYVACGCDGIEQRVKAYLTATLATTEQVYILDKANGLDGYTMDHADERAFVAARLAAGAQELRDEIVDAWHSSATIAVGYPLIKVSDIESRAVVLTPELLAAD